MITVETRNPLIVGGNKISNPSKYLSFNGSNSADVRKFQDWMDANHPGWVNGKNLNEGAGYGTFGPATKAAWASYGGQYEPKKTVTGIMETEERPTAVKKKITGAQVKAGAEKAVAGAQAAKGIFDSLKDVFKKPGVEVSTNAPVYEAGAPTGGEGKAMKNSTKIMIAAGAVIVLGTIIYFATKKKK